MNTNDSSELTTEGELRQALATIETYKHVREVRENMRKFIGDLLARSLRHDDSKFESPEVEIFGAHTHELGQTEYGSPEYKALLEKVKPAIDHHYKINRHHPEFYSFKEEWKPVTGHDGIYEVSNYGQVRSLICRSRNDNVKEKTTVLKQNVTPKGYKRCQLSIGEDVKNHMVHRLVAEAFIPNPQNKPIVNHKNGVKDDNSVENLEWCTHGENLVHAYDEGLKITEPKYVIVCEELEIITLGIVEMARKVRAAGYEKITESGIFNCISRDCVDATHFGLHFKGYPLQEIKEDIFIKRFTLADFIEMICDWKAAALRGKNGDIMKSIDINQRKYGFDNQIRKILENTVREYFTE